MNSPVSSLATKPQAPVLVFSMKEALKFTLTRFKGGLVQLTPGREVADADELPEPSVDSEVLVNSRKCFWIL
jgi:hypothetical protein